MDTVNRTILLIMLAIGSIGSAEAAGARTFYRLDATLKMAGDVPGWDYLALDKAHSHLFLARRTEGATVIDTKTNRQIATIANSEGTNTFALATPFDLGYAVTGKGDATIFRLSTLETIRRIHFGDNADAATFDPVTQQVIVTMPDSDAVIFLDGKTGEVRGRAPVDSGGEIESPVPDGTGHIFVTLRNRNAVARIDARRFKVDAIWDTGSCVQPAGLAYDANHHRLFAGCRGHGADPRLGVVDTDNGSVVTTLPIGRGCDGVVYDAGSATVITSNGVDGNIVIYRQQDADTYKLSEATTTRPYARTMAMDHETRTLYLVTAEGTADPSRTIKTGIAPFYPNRYFPGTYTLLVYSPR
ncbi:MAG TPA: hypothetical protein VJ998_09450 [Pseudomonadales bacterium]|nr:hypothetical protein [Pseudomonadales bacterium]